MSELADRIEEALGRRPQRLARLHGGMVAEVVLATFDDAERVVVKRAPEGDLELEAFMLRYLAANSALPVPAVLHAAPGLLVLDYLDGTPGIPPAAETEAADLLAGLHATEGPGFGFDRTTLIGPYPQANPWRDDWPAFFGEARLQPMTAAARDEGRLGRADARKLDALAGRLGGLLDHEPRPSLVHGDVWSGNVLCRGGRVVGFLDPSLAFVDAEVELAYLELFDTVGPTFFARYETVRPLDPAYRGLRRDLYQLYPLLVHVRLFGDEYLPPLRHRLDRLAAV